MGDGGSVARRVDLDVCLNAAVSSVFLDSLEVSNAPDEARVIGAFSGEFGNGWDL